MNKQKKTTESDTENKQVVARREAVGRRREVVEGLPVTK